MSVTLDVSVIVGAVDWCTGCKTALYHAAVRIWRSPVYQAVRHFGVDAAQQTFSGARAARAAFSIQSAALSAIITTVACMLPHT